MPQGPFSISGFDDAMRAQQVFGQIEAIAGGVLFQVTQNVGQLQGLAEGRR